MKEFPNYEVRLFIGQRRGYAGDMYSKKELIALIKRFQTEYAGESLPVRVAETMFVHEQYEEDGFELATTLFHRMETTQIDKFMLELAEFLMIRLDQERVTVMTSGRTYLITN